MRKRAALGTLVLVAGLLSLIALELGLRVYSTLFLPKMMILDDELGWKHVPHTAKAYRGEVGEPALMAVNADGLRGPERAAASPVGVQRVLVLGDSFTEGAGIADEDLVSAVLERTLAHTEFLNAGVGAYSTVQEYLYLLQSGLRFRPDLVLLMFFENDLVENCLSYEPSFGPRPYATLADGHLRFVRELEATKYLKYTIPVPFRLTLNRYSYLYYFLNRLYQRVRAAEMRHWIQEDAAEVGLTTQYRIFFALIAEMKRQLGLRQIGLLVVLIPTKGDLAAGRSPTIDSILGFCQQSGIRCLSLFERFQRESAAGAAPYYPTDIHWTKVGHRIAADEIGRHLPEVVSITAAQ